MERLLLSVALAASGLAAHAQSQRPRVEVTPVVEPATVRAGASVRAVLQVRLPKDLHVQSDKPRDPLLIPTALTINQPAGVTVERITYPAATDLAQAGRKDKLAVFGPSFDIEARLVIAPDVPAGELIVPAVLRYQACNDEVCFPPARATTAWTLRVEAAPGRP